MEPESPLEERLSPAARLALEELLEDVRAEILARAASRAAGTGEITVTDIVTSAEAVQRRSELARRSLLERVMVVYAGLGITIAMAAFAFGFADDFTMPVTLTASTGLALALVAVLTTTFLQLRHGRRMLSSIEQARIESPLLATAHFLNGWNDLEVMAREVIARELGESRAGEPLSRIVRQLADMQVLSEEEIANFRSLLELRNALVHGKQEPDPAAMNDAIRRTQELQHRLSRALA